MSEYTDILVNLQNKYSNNPNMLKKLNSYMHNLPTVLDNCEKDLCKREKNKEDLTEQMNTWAHNFLEEHQYFYEDYQKIYIEYDGNSYKQVNENEIAHKILHTLNSDKDMREGFKWKHKTRIHLLKIIKERSLYKSVPNSNTIQNVLTNLYPNTFKTKNHAKYFLTILGNCILNKKDSNIYFADNSFKEFLNNLNTHILHVTGKNFLSDIFKFKYYNHQLGNCRILDVYEPRLNSNFINDKTYDILVVSSYCAHRFGSSDDFLTKHCKDKIFVDNALYLYTNNKNRAILNNFYTEFTLPTTNSDEYNISYKFIYFLWRQFLKKHNLPHVFSQDEFKSMLQTDNIYDLQNPDKILEGIKSKYTLDITNFQTFWLQNISIHRTGSIYEIDEICNLFNDWCIGNKQNINVNEEQLREMILCLYPDIKIDDNKYINNVVCKLWDKQLHIDMAMSAMKLDENNSFNTLDCYKYYCKYVKTHYDARYIVSKSFFDEYVGEN